MKNIFWLIALLISTNSTANADLAKYFTAGSKSWQKTNVPDGVAFICLACDGQTMIQINAIPVNPNNPKAKTNEAFLAQYQTKAQQESFAKNMVKGQIPIDTKDINIEVFRTGFVKIGGKKAFQFSTAVEMKPYTTIDTTALFIHKDKIIKVSLNYYDGMFGAKSRKAVNELYSSIKLSP